MEIKLHFSIFLLLIKSSFSSSWKAFATGILNAQKVEDGNADTYVNLDESPDGNTLHFSIKGNEHMLLG